MGSGTCAVNLFTAVIKECLTIFCLFCPHLIFTTMQELTGRGASLLLAAAFLANICLAGTVN
jgi:hypothetical protein